MQEKVKEKCDQLIRNWKKLETEYKWYSAGFRISGALAFSAVNREVDSEAISRCKEIVDNNSGFLSTARSSIQPIIVCKMSLSDDPVQYFENLRIVMEQLGKKFFAYPEYLAQLAMGIVDSDRMYEVDSLITRLKDLQKRMSKEHPFLTSSDDLIYALLLVLTDRPADLIIKDMEECFIYLKKELKVKVGQNEMQGMGEILALTEGDIKTRCDKAVKIYDTFAEHGVKYGKNYNEFAALGALIDIDIDTDSLVSEIIETSDYLKPNEGFNGLAMDDKARLTFAAMLIGDAYSNESFVIGKSGNTVPMIILQQMEITRFMIQRASTDATLATNMTVF